MRLYKRSFAKISSSGGLLGYDAV